MENKLIENNPSNSEGSVNFEANSRERRFWLHSSFSKLEKWRRRSILIYIQNYARNNLNVDNKSGDYVCDLNSLPDNIIDVIYEIATANAIDDISTSKKRKREECNEVSEYEPSTKKQKIEGADEEKEEEQKKLRFTISITVIRLDKKDDSKKPYSCDICKRKFTDRSNLRKHIRIHTKELPYECKVCKKRFRYTQTLREHMNRHNKIKPNECEVCKKSFASASNLKRHLRTHTGEKPYQCEKCGKEFKQSSNLRTHLKSKHGIIVEGVINRKKKKK